MRRSWWLGLLLSCVHTPPPPPPALPHPPPPPAAQIPLGCEAPLTGEYAQFAHREATWVATDDLDAGRLELITRVETRRDAGPAPRRFSRDGGLPWLVRVPDGGLRREDAALEESREIRTTLLRTPRGFVGRTTANDGGCAFASAIVECRDDGLTIETEAAKGAGCIERPDAGRVRLILTRADAGSLRSDSGPELEGDDGGRPSDDGG